VRRSLRELADEPALVPLADLAALEAVSRITPSYEPAAMLLRSHRLPLLAGSPHEADAAQTSGVLEGFDDHEKANLRIILREAIAAREEIEKAAQT
jgi:hypothetical protein